MYTEQVKAALTGLQKSLPAPVRDWQIEEGTDHMGQEAVWVWAVLDDADLTQQVRQGVWHAVWDTVTGLGLAADPWVYVRFRSTSEV